MSPCNVVVLTMSCCSWFSISILLLIPLSTWRNIRDLRRQNGRQGVRDPRWAGVALPFVRKTRRSAQVIPQIPLKWIVKKRSDFPRLESSQNLIPFVFLILFSSLIFLISPLVVSTPCLHSNSITETIIKLKKTLDLQT